MRTNQVTQNELYTLIYSAVQKHAEAVESDRFNYLAGIQMPWGKYEGNTFGEIPLSYLDHCSRSQLTWFDRRLTEFVEAAMRRNLARYPTASVNELLKHSSRELEEIFSDPEEK